MQVRTEASLLPQINLGTRPYGYGGRWSPLFGVAALRWCYNVSCIKATTFEAFRNEELEMEEATSALGP